MDDRKNLEKLHYILDKLGFDAGGLREGLAREMAKRPEEFVLKSSVETGGGRMDGKLYFRYSGDSYIFHSYNARLASEDGKKPDRAHTFMVTDDMPVREACNLLGGRGVAKLGFGDKGFYYAWQQMEFSDKGAARMRDEVCNFDYGGTLENVSALLKGQGNLRDAYLLEENFLKGDCCRIPFVEGGKEETLKLWADPRNREVVIENAKGQRLPGLG